MNTSPTPAITPRAETPSAGACDNDELEAIGNQQLSEVFAVEVAEIWRVEKPRDGGVRAYSVIKTGAWREIRAGQYGPDDLPDFATDVNVVLPWLPKDYQRAFWTATGGFLGARVCIWEKDMIVAEAHTPSFARSAAIALIRAKRAEKGSP